MVLAACGADRKAAADGMRAIIDVSGGAVGWRATGSASWPQQLDLAIAGRRGVALAADGKLIDTEEEMTNNSLVVLRRRGNTVEKRTGGRAAPTTVNSLVRTREYLTGRA
jgi:hypothetical protein